MKKRLWIIILGFIPVPILTLNAYSTTIIFTDRSLWESEVTSLNYNITDIDFEDTTLYSDSGEYTVIADDVVFTSNISLTIAESMDGYASGNALFPGFNQTIQIGLPENVYAFGFDLGEIPISQDEDDPSWVTPFIENVVLSTGDEFLDRYYGEYYPEYAFFGFISDRPIDTVSLRAYAYSEAFIDNFTYAETAAAPVPEPSTIAMMIIGIFGFFLKNRRRACFQ